MTLAELIEALEKSDTSSIALDAEIYLTCEVQISREKQAGWDAPISLQSYALMSVVSPCFHFTSSLDAALKLLPNHANCDGYEKTPDGVEAFVSKNNVSEGHWYTSGFHKSSRAIALCIAALKARNSITPPDAPARPLTT